jgi:gluconolactonase
MNVVLLGPLGSGMLAGSGSQGDPGSGRNTVPRVEGHVRERRWAVVGAGAFALLVAAWCGTAAPAAGTAPPASLRSLLAPGAKLKLFAGGLGYAEGPLWLPDGHLIVSDIYANSVLEFDAAGKRSVFRRPSNGANGHALDAHGSVIEADAGGDKSPGRIVKVASDGTATVLADNYQGKPFLEPNDLIVKRDGTIWFTDPNLSFATPPGKAVHSVYRLDPKSKVVTRLTKALSGPNGIAFSPDQKTLYVTDTNGNGLVSFAIRPDGTLGRERHLQIIGCDGIGVDERGDIWVTTCANYVLITNPAGKQIGEIDVPGTTTNLAWGGSDGKTLFITTQEGRIYRLALTVREAH